MNTLYLIGCSILLAGIIGALFLPLLRGSYRGTFYFSMGGGRGQHLKLQRRVLIENLRDIAIEKDGEKMDESEFEQLAEPLSRELEKVERDLSLIAAGKDSRGRARHFCPVCGARGTLFESAHRPTYCEQCGSEFKTTAPAS